MHNRLENMAQMLSYRDIMSLDKSFAQIDKKARITKDEQQRILSSVMERAADMNVTNRTKDTIYKKDYEPCEEGESRADAIKVTGRKPAMLVSIAAALIAVVAIAAVVNIIGGGDGFSVFSPADSVTDTPKNSTESDPADNTYRAVESITEKELFEQEYGSGFYEFIVKNGLEKSDIGENDDYRGTVTSVISNGRYAAVTVELTAKTDKARKQIADSYVEYHTNVFDALTLDNGAIEEYESSTMPVRISDDTVWFRYIYTLPKDNRTRFILQFYPRWAGYSPYYDNEAGENTENPEGININVDLSCNIPTKDIYSEDGIKLSMSAMGICGEIPFKSFDERLCYLIESLSLKKADGSSIEIKETSYCRSISQYEYLNMKNDESAQNEIIEYFLEPRVCIDVNEYSGTVINGLAFSERE